MNESTTGWWDGFPLNRNSLLMMSPQVQKIAVFLFNFWKTSLCLSATLSQSFLKSGSFGNKIFSIKLCILTFTDQVRIYCGSLIGGKSELWVDSARKICHHIYHVTIFREVGATFSEKWVFFPKTAGNNRLIFLPFQRYRNDIIAFIVRNHTCLTEFQSYWVLYTSEYI